MVRLCQMLFKLNQGERLVPQVLADEFGVNLHTIQRDLSERSSYLPLQKGDGRYALAPAFLGQISGKDIERFASLAGIWLGQEKKEVVLKVAKEVAGYFKRRRMITNQVIEKDLEDGGLIVSAKVAHLNQILHDRALLDSACPHHQSGGAAGGDGAGNVIYLKA